MPNRRREAGPDLFSLRCDKCGRPLVRTASGYLACILGHGGLRIEQEAELTASEDDRDLFDLGD